MHYPEVSVRELHVDQVSDAVRRLCVSANHEISEDHRAALERARSTERSPIGCRVLDSLLANADVAAEDRIALCPDTGCA